MAYIGNPLEVSNYVVDTFSGNGTLTSFTLSRTPAGINSVLVVIYGAVQSPTNYVISGTTLTFVQAPPPGLNNIEVRHLGLGAVGFVPANATVTPEKLSTTALTWTTDGKIGIGTSSPDAKLTVNGEIKTTSGIRFSDGTVQTTAASGTGTSFNAFPLSAASPGPLTFSGNSLSGFYAYSSTDFPGNYYVGLNIRSGGSAAGQLAMNWNTEETAPTKIYFRTNDDTSTTSAWSPWTRLLTEKDIFVDSNGNVGIGSAAPGRKLDVEGDGRFVQVQAATTGAITLRQNSGDTVGAHIQWVNNANTVERGWLVVDTSSNMIFATQSTERMRIDGSGNLGIGVTSPSAKLHVNGQVLAGAGSATTPAFGVGDNNSGFFRISQADSSIGVSISGVERFRLQSNGLRFPDGSVQTTAATFSSAQFSNNGYQRFPSGLILQWCFGGTHNTETAITVTFPIAFPSVCINVMLGTLEPQGGRDAMYQLMSFDNTGCVAKLNSFNTFGGTCQAIVWAVGY